LRTWHIALSQSSSAGGSSGIKTKSAPVLHGARTEDQRPERSRARERRTDLTPARSASQPQWRPITSTTKARECDEAVDEIESIDSQMRWSAVRPPIVRSVMAMSLLSGEESVGNDQQTGEASKFRRQQTHSMEPTRPTMLRWAWAWAWASEIWPSARRTSTIDGHSRRRKSAPVSEPSPPQTTRQSMPCSIRCSAASWRPSGVRTERRLCGASVGKLNAGEAT
jgi:hypothetical protein